MESSVQIFRGEQYLHEKKIRYPEEHEKFYATLTGMSRWVETVEAISVQEAFDKAKMNLRALSGNSAMQRILQRTKYMYAEDGSCRKLSVKI